MFTGVCGDSGWGASGLIGLWLVRWQAGGHRGRGRNLRRVSALSYKWLGSLQTLFSQPQHALPLHPYHLSLLWGRDRKEEKRKRILLLLLLFLKKRSDSILCYLRLFSSWLVQAWLEWLTRLAGGAALWTVCPCEASLDWSINHLSAHLTSSLWSSRAYTVYACIYTCPKFFTPFANC